MAIKLTYRRKKAFRLALWALAVSLIAHIMIFTYLMRRPPAIALKPQHQPVHVQLTSKPKIVAPTVTPIAKTKARPGAGDQGPQKESSAKANQTTAAGKTSSAPKGIQEKLRYADLLNLSKEDAGKDFGATNYVAEPYRGNALAEIKASGSDVSASLDLPLVLRQQLKEGKAWVKLKRHPDAIEIINLAGQPELRAALYEALQSRRTVMQLHALFDQFQTEEYRVTVEYRTQYGAISPHPFDTSIKVFDRDITLITTQYPDAPKYGVNGLVIEDKYSRRAKRKDKEHLERLRASPAFSEPLSGVFLRL